MSHYTMPNKYGKCTRDFGVFLFLLVSTFLYFGGVLNKTIILLAPRWLSIISYPTRARRIIVKYNYLISLHQYSGFHLTVESHSNLLWSYITTPSDCDRHFLIQSELSKTTTNCVAYVKPYPPPEEKREGGGYGYT